MNRQDRRKAARKADDTRSNSVEVLGYLRAYEHGTVYVDGAAWTYIFGGNYILTQQHISAPEMPVSTPQRRAVCNAFLTRPLIDPAPIPLEVLRAIDGYLTAEERRTHHDGNAVFRVGERSFPWSFMRTAIELLRGQPEALEVLVGRVSDDVIRMDAPTMRLALNYCVPVQGAPGCELLDAAGVAMLEATDVEGPRS